MEKRKKGAMRTKVPKKRTGSPERWLAGARFMYFALPVDRFVLFQDIQYVIWLLDILVECEAMAVYANLPA